MNAGSAPVMSVTIDSNDSRSIKAIELAAGAGQWLKCHTLEGHKAFGVPSQCRPGRYYLVDGQACTCEDFKRNGLSLERRGANGYHGPCKHVLAVRLHCELVKAQREQPPQRRAGHLTLLPSPVAALAAKYADVFTKFEGQ
jgi:hypothetical protein